MLLVCKLFFILDRSMYLFFCTMLRFNVNYGSSEQQVMIVALEENNYSIQDIWSEWGYNRVFKQMETSHLKHQRSSYFHKQRRFRITWKFNIISFIWLQPNVQFQISWWHVFTINFLISIWETWWHYEFKYRLNSASQKIKFCTNSSDMAIWT